MTVDAARSRKRITAITVVSVAVLVGLIGRSVVSDGENSAFVRWLPWLDEPAITLFYGDATGHYLVPVSRTLSSDDVEPDALVETLLAGPADGSGLVILIPDGTAASSVALEDGVLSVDLSGSYGARASELTHESVLQSMRSWPGVDTVAITVDGIPLDFDSTGHLIYFYDEAHDMLVARPTDMERPGDVLAEYLAGSGDPSLAGLPSDVESLGVTLGSNELLTLDFTFRDSLREYAIDHPSSVRRVLEGLIATFSTGFPEVSGVLLDFEGRNALGLGQCANLLNTVQSQPEVLNDERLLSRYADTS